MAVLSLPTHGSMGDARVSPSLSREPPRYELHAADVSPSCKMAVRYFEARKLRFQNVWMIQCGGDIDILFHMLYYLGAASYLELTELAI